MPTRTTTLSSAGTATIALDPVSKSTTVMLSASLASSVSTIGIEASLDIAGQFGAGTATWVPLSSGTAILSSASAAGYSLMYTVLSPIAMVRLNSSTHAGSSTVFTLKTLQSVTA